MEVILIEKIEKLGNIGDQVTVKNGFARNYLIPQNKALRSNTENKAYFEQQKQDILKKNEEIKQAAKKVFDKTNDKSVVIIAHASDEGRLYGSVLPKDIANKINSNFKTEIKKSQIILDSAIRKTGITAIKLRIHADYSAKINLNIARSEDEAKKHLKELNKENKETEENKGAQKTE